MRFTCACPWWTFARQRRTCGEEKKKKNHDANSSSKYDNFNVKFTASPWGNQTARSRKGSTESLLPEYLPRAHPCTRENNIKGWTDRSHSCHWFFHMYSYCLFFLTWACRRGYVRQRKQSSDRIQTFRRRYRPGARFLQSKRNDKWPIFSLESSAIDK